MHRLAQSVLGYIRKHDLLRAGDRVAAAVSGGADSVALLRVLLEVQPELGIVLSVLHLNHNLRAAESDADEQFVRELGRAHGLEVICESRDVKAYAAEKKLGLEAGSRAVRYEFFREALQGNLDRIATAHTLDDQAETVLMKLARGAGTRGLAGVYPELNIQYSSLSVQPTAKAIVRPLLAQPREQLTAYLAELRQDWREDSSNRDLRHTRNRVRHGILPRLKRHVNPSVREALAEAAEIARMEEEYWAEEIAQIQPKVWTRTERGGVLNCLHLAELRLALQRRLVRTAGRSLGLGLEFRHVEEVLALSEEGTRTSLPEGWVVSRQKGSLRFELTSSAPTGYRYALPVPGQVTIPEAGLTLNVLAVRMDLPDEGYNPERLLDSKYARRGLIVRNWHAGERFWPSHSKQPKKIKDLLQSRHISGLDKKLWPVVASGDEIVWVRGLGVRRDLQAKDGNGVLIQEAEIA